MKTITPETFGDPKQYPVLISLSNILNELKDHSSKRCSNLLQEYNKAYLTINGIAKESKPYYYDLIKNDFLNRLEISYINGLPEAVYTHMRNFLISIHRHKLRTI